VAVQSGQRGVPLRVVERETEAMLGATAHAANMTRVWPGATTRLRERAAGEVRATQRETHRERETEAMLGATAHAANMTRVWPGHHTPARASRGRGESSLWG
jgi:hypothetical protein